MSTDENISRVRELYVQAARINDDAARQAFLDQACGGQTELRQHVEKLIAARAVDRDNVLHLATADSMSGRNSFSPDGDELGETFQSHPEAMGAEKTSNDAIRGRIDISTHPMIGNYRLLEELGHGGMGTVYMAGQSKPVKRQVALKVIKPGMDSKEVIARFEAERQALAMMDHPHIARVLDGGTTDEGRPYFVMELVRGVPITEFCKRKSLLLRERLELFVDICHAVQHAHQKGIIHRDLKPGNIMVTLHDGKPVVKVIDFGVAKALHQDLTERTLFTHFSQMVGTPLYMAPEQAEMSGLGVDTRSDIYSLGVVLYELLTGTTPFDRDTMSKLGIDGIRKLIQEQEPPRPSARLSTLKAANRSTIEDQRQLDTDDIAKQLNREVDWIVMKALEKDRERRYETANAFAADIQRFLNDEPIEAYPPSMRYRLGKYSRRHKGVLGTVAAVILALMFGVGLATWQAVVASEAAELAEQERAEAERNMEAAMDAVERLLSNVSNPQLASVPGLQESWANILKETIHFYERFKTDSGSSHDIDQRAAKVYLHYGSLLQTTNPASRDSIKCFRRGLELAEHLVLEQPKRTEFRELLADMHLACAQHGISPRNTVDENSDDVTWNHLQQAQDQFALLSLADPGNQEYRERQGSVYVRMAEFVRNRSSTDPRIEPLVQQAADLGFEMTHAVLARLLGDLAPKLASQHWKKAISEYRSNPARMDFDRLNFMFIGRIEKVIDLALDDDDQILKDVLWVLGKGIRSDYDTLQQFPTNRRVYNVLHDLSWKYSQLLLKNEPWKKSIAKLDGLVEQAPEMHAVRAIFLRDCKDYEKEDRLAALNTAISEYPSYAVYYRVRGLIHKRLGRTDDALADFDAAIRVDRNDSWSFYHRAELYFNLTQYDRAASDYSVRLATMRTWRMPYVLKRRAIAYYRAGKYEQALADLQQAAARAPNDSSIATWISPSELAACPDPAFRAGIMQLADQLIAFNDGSANSYVTRASFLLGLGELERAKDDLSEIIQRDDAGYYQTYQAALIAWKLDDRAGFGELSQKLVSATDDASEPIAKHFAAWTASLSPNALVNYDRAIELAAATFEQVPSDAQFRTGHGAILMRAGKYDEAKKQLEEALDYAETDKTSPSYTRYFLAMTEHHLGDTKNAQSHLRKAIEIAESELSESPPWNRRLTLELLRKEAESQITPPQNGPQVKSNE